jgi:PAS domain S-box-containing protein
MDLQFPPFIWPLLVAIIASVTLLVIVWRRRPGPGVMPFAALMVAVTFWSLCNLLEMLVTDYTIKFIFVRFNYLGITVVPAAWLVFVLEYTGRIQQLSRRNLQLLAIEPVLVQLFIWTNAYHHLFWTYSGLRESGGYVFQEAVYGAAFWAHGLYSYLLILAGTVLLIRALVRAPDLYRGQITWLLVGTFTPWVGNMMYLSGLNPLPDIDLTPLAFSITGLTMGWSLYRYRLLDIAPVARDTMFESMSDAVVVLDTQNRIVDVNPSALTLLERGKSAEMIGKKLREVVPQYQDMIDRFRDSEDARAEIAIDGAGAKRYFELRISPLRGQSRDLTGRLIVLHETTARKMAEEQIRAQNEVLVRTNRDLAVAREQAVEANRLKSEFLATISHELRTPLNSIIGYADLLLTGLAGELSEKQRDYIRRSLSNGERLLTLINELLDISKMEAGRLELLSAPFSLSELLMGVRERMQSLADRKGLAWDTYLDPGLPAILLGDAKRLEQIMVNLVGNAVKYTEAGRVELRLEKADDGQWAIVVLDTGIGIPPHAIEYIFDKFRQVDGSTHRQYQGTGLGLAIVRELTHLMNGTVHLDSEVGKGSTFTVKLPMTLPGEQSESMTVLEDRAG